ncbi:D-tyrosyl-tRNA(Tyr) deacylase [Flexibacter flexilis DSM 6793]|uniref:D-aminoacyl-tRNA deacylase n=1 Tax=Flexibacter flexilis DSM 6793 TaxID=927664 RepID=A0A1I1JL80_9BACT|nr:D-aminoacyl-tRNA deacylase [Flexibacter flexilis]SFC48712.1 D-tyrosyl-tRNA(Tyr) deacylase [Flexibacter flexilis DSM 6793]
MVAVIQRVTEAAVRIDGHVNGQIEAGLLVLLGIATIDTADDVQWLAAKIAAMRIFSDEEGKMNKSVQDINGNILLISQFTLLASTKKGNRPSFIEAARPEIAISLYEQMIQELGGLLGKPVQTGVFGADMKVSLLNDGPVTIVIDSQNKK